MSRIGNYLVGIASLAVLSYVLYDCPLLKRVYNKKQTNTVSQIDTNNTNIAKNLEEKLKWTITVAMD